MVRGTREQRKEDNRRFYAILTGLDANMSIAQLQALPAAPPPKPRNPYTRAKYVPKSIAKIRAIDRRLQEAHSPLEVRLLGDEGKKLYKVLMVDPQVQEVQEVQEVPVVLVQGCNSRSTERRSVGKI